MAGDGEGQSEKSEAVVFTSMPSTKQQPSLGQRMFNSFKRAETSSDGERSDLELENGKGDSNLKQTLSSRHLQMIAIGGSIGTGLFIGSGVALTNGGPASLLISFVLVAFMMFNIIQALGELSVLFPIEGSFSIYSTRFIDPAWGFAIGWNYFMMWMVVLPLQLTAAGMVINYWNTGVNIGVYITIFLLFITAINFFGVKGYGEAEVLLSMVKVIAVIGFMILAVVIDVGGVPKGGYLGVKTWSNPGAFANGFKGLCSVLVTAAFSFLGTELVGLASAESVNPRVTLPRACKQVFWRVAFFYIISLLLIGFIVPYNEPRLLSGSSQFDANASPFVIAIENAGIKVLPSIFNAVILISVLSVGNSAVYGSSRTLVALANNGQAPSFLTYVDRKGRPLFGLAVALSSCLLAYINVAPVGMQVLNWLMSISGLSGLFTWGSICLAHIRFRLAWKTQGYSVDDIPFRAAFGAWGSLLSFIFTIVCLAAQFYVAISPVSGKGSATTFFRSYLGAVILFIAFMGYKLIKKTKLIKVSEIDLVSGRRDFNLKELREQEAIERREWNFLKKAYRTLC